MTKIKLKVLSNDDLNSYLKRFSSLNKRLLVELSFDSREIIAKTSNENRSIVKSSVISIGGIFDESTMETLDKPLLIGLHDIGTIISILNTMSDDVELEITYADYDTEYVAETIKFSTSNVTITVPCLNVKLFRRITNDIFTSIIEIGVDKTEFVYDAVNIDKTIKLLSFDLTINSGITDTAELAKFVANDKGIHLESDQINYLIADEYDGVTNNALFNKEILSHLDKGENQHIVYDTEKIIFKSDISDTTVIIGQSE